MKRTLTTTTLLALFAVPFLLSQTLLRQPFPLECQRSQPGAYVVAILGQFSSSPGPAAVSCVVLDPAVFEINDQGLTIRNLAVLPRFSDAETPSGVINGSNRVFTLQNGPNPASSLVVTRNGLTLQSGADYTLSGNTVTFNTGSAPNTGDLVRAWYRY